MLSQEVQSVIREALVEVHKRRHEFLTIEHILYAMTKNIHGKILLEGSGASVPVLREQLETFFIKEMECIEENIRIEIIQTESVQRVLTRALNQIHSSGRQVVELGDLLVSIMEEDDSYALFFLRKQGVDSLDVKTFISHGLNEQSDNRSENNTNKNDDNSNANPLDLYAINLTNKAIDGKIDPLIGRDIEIERTIEILSRRKKNNPLYVGEPGVGKTAMAEGLALRIAEKKVPEKFFNVQIFALDMGLLLAGTRYRGDFENRIKSVIKALMEKPEAIIFIDEIHTIVGAGNSSGAMDASNLLKPALSNGELRCIGSTTYEEFKNHFEKDRAIARRFQRIDLKEPSKEDTLAILEGLEKKYADFHNVKYGKIILKNIIDLSILHLKNKMLPDKAIDILDETGAMVRLKNCNGETSCNGSFLQVCVEDVEKVVARMAGIPQRSVSGRERVKLWALNRNLKNLVFGQDEAIDLTIKAILRSRAGLGQAKRPSASFLFYGPTGVGKTEIARSLASLLHIEFLRFDMSEYMEKHSVARLIGAPPGYVGFEHGGLLTEAVRKSPYAVVLLDEVEKAHPDIFNVLLQVMDYATLTDSSGRKTDFSNIILIMTSNAGAFEMSNNSIGFSQSMPMREASYKALKAVEKLFSPEFRNRLDAMVPFNSLSNDMMVRIVKKFIGEIKNRLRERNVTLTITEKAVVWLSVRGFDPSMGARPVQRILRTEVEDKLANEILFGKLKKGGNARFSVNNQNDTLVMECIKK